MNHRRRTEFYRESSLNSNMVESMEINHARDRNENHLDSDVVVKTIELAFSYLKRYELNDWIFVVDNAKKRGGQCRYKQKTISMAEGFILHASTDEIKDTILHEIAHALVGSKHGHDEVWQAKAKEIGCSAERTHSVKFSQPNYYIKCVNTQSCGMRIKRQRVKVSSLQRNGSYCNRCGGGLIVVDIKNNTSTQITKGLNER